MWRIALLGSDYAAGSSRLPISFCDVTGGDERVVDRGWVLVLDSEYCWADSSRLSEISACPFISALLRDNLKISRGNLS